LVRPSASAYQVSKLALIRLSEFLNAEYANKGLLAFSIHPGNCLREMIGGPEGLNPALKHGIFLSRSC
jgi:NAD(P)-dependent dehydrogenase (short-subunit alcohol dehydrogenase family)